MDKDGLRLILIIVGVLIIAGILLFGNPERRKRRHASKRQQGAQSADEEASSETENDVFQQELEDIGKLIEEDREINAGEDDAVLPVVGPKTPAAPEPDMIVSLYLRARVNRMISGVQLLEATTKAGLHFGDMDIFHRIPEGDSQPIFSLANLVSPGNFDPEGWNLFETPGVSLFLSLPGPVGGLDAWDAMLATGQRLSELLHADLLDDAQRPVTRQRIAEIREALREYFRFRRLICVVGVLADKNLEGIAGELAKAASLVIATRSRHPRSATPAAVAKAFRRFGAEVREADGVDSALGSALGQAGEADLVVVTGSLFVAAEAREAVLGIPPEVYPSLLPGNAKAAQWAI